MKKSKNPIKIARTTIASVKKEMQRPRLTESVRNDGIDLDAQVVEDLLAPPEKV
jgi:hypothetical protein